MVVAVADQRSITMDHRIPLVQVVWVEVVQVKA
jgi:hypothetical protein